MPLPLQVLLTLTTDGTGQATLPGLPGGIGPATLYTQALLLDLAQPQGFQITNAVELVFLP